MSETPTNSFPLLGRIRPTSNDRAVIQRLTKEAEDGKRPIGDARREMRATAGFSGLALPEQFLYRWEGKELVFWEHPGETPTNRTPEVVSLPNGTCSVDTGVGRTVFAAPADQAPELLSAERLAEIQELALEWHAYYTKKAYTSWPPRLATTNRRELLTHAAALTAHALTAEARAAEAEAQVAMLRVELAEREGRADCHCSARSNNECTCKESQATL